jgi:hypothetical protein
MTSASPIAKLYAISPASVLLQFIYLQALDLLSTVAFLMSGVAEANPLIRFAMRTAGDPLVGLISIKATAFILAMTCLALGKVKLLQKANVFFALLVVWNLVSLILGLLMRAR